VISKTDVYFSKDFLLDMQKPANNVLSTGPLYIIRTNGEYHECYAHLSYIDTDLLNLKVLRPQVLDDLLVGLDGLRDRRPEPIEYTLDRELLHRVCQIGSTIRGGSHVQSRRSSLRPSVRPFVRSSVCPFDV